MSKRVIIAGSRILPATTQQDADLRVWLNKAFELFEPDLILCGDAVGIDTLGMHVARENGTAVVHYPADWHTYGKRAGYLRNEQMAQNADELWRIWDGKSRGSAMMKGLAIQYELKVLEYVV